MNELKEGMFLRHSGLEGDGPIIQKIIKLETPGRCGGKYKVFTDKCGDWFIDSDYIEIEKSKASYNIIDLIEVGDYVNGMLVIEHSHTKELYTVYDYVGGKGFTTIEGYGNKLNNIKIESIVTKEQFESMSYKIGD